MKTKKIALLILICLVIGAVIYNIKKVDTKPSTEAATIKQKQTINQESYDEMLNKLLEKRKTLTNVNEARILLFELINKIIPEYWIGTKWDFNGVTRKPKEGTIACGYFITNTLTDIDFKIQRVKLAQEPSSKMINQLCVNVKRFADFNNLMTYLDEQPNESIFIIGLDFHTGYVIKTKDEIYFLHANYIDNEGVIKEKIEISRSLRSSKSFMIGNLTANNDLLKQWIK